MDSKKNLKKSRGREKEKSQRDTAGVTLEYAKSFLIALVLALLIKATIIEAYKIPTESMESTLLAGDFIIGNKFIYGIKIPFTGIRLPALREPRRGDIIIFRPPHSPHENYVKRCIGLPGDTIQVINKKVYINGEPYQDEAFIQHKDREIFARGQYYGGDPYMSPQVRALGIHNDGYRTYPPFRDNSLKIVVPEGKYFMMGDNRDHSLDSRMWGFVDREKILGKALLIHWSWKIKDHWDDSDNVPHVELRQPLSVIPNILYNLVHFPQRVSWDRLGNIPK
jgi:signal peptidase I